MIIEITIAYLLLALLFFRALSKNSCCFGGEQTYDYEWKTFWAALFWGVTFLYFSLRLLQGALDG